MTRLCRALLLIVLSLASVLGCAEKSADTCGDTDAAPVDPTLLAFLSRARAAHHLADQHEQDENLEAAITPLEKLIAGPVPGGSTPAPEAREVLADTRARLADFESRRGRFDEAAAHVDRGLEQAREVTYFRGHLFEVRGLVEERRAKQLRERGDSAAAEAAKKRALDAFEQSMEIQGKVIDSTLGEGDADKPQNPGDAR
jgi:tetratricopeptide (TPR) repeat protein